MSTIIFGGSDRAILGAPITFHVATTGSDTTGNGSATKPWATLQKAMDYISANLDLGGFTVTVSVGAGTFVGFGVKSTVGGGVLQWNGAGSLSTIITHSIADNVFTFGDCVSWNTGTDTVIAFNDLQFFQDAGANYGLAVYLAGQNPFLGDYSAATNLDLAFKFTANAAGGITIQGQSLLFSQATGGISVIGTGVSIASMIFLVTGAQFQDGAPWTLSGTANAVSNWLFASDSSNYAAVGSSFSGTNTGHPYKLQGGSSARGSAPGTLGSAFFPGAAGTGLLDQNSNYDDRGFYQYNVPVTGFSVVMTDNTLGLILDPAGTLATGTVTLPPNPVDGTHTSIRSSQVVTTLTVSPNTGQSVLGNPSTIAAGGVIDAVYRVANKTWYC